MYTAVEAGASASVDVHTVLAILRGSMLKSRRDVEETNRATSLTIFVLLVLLCYCYLRIVKFV